jgi:hypothetical protein
MYQPRGTLGAVRRVPLDRVGRRWALLREPGGLDEQSVGGRDTLEAIRLVDRLLVEDPGAVVAPGGAAMLTVPERDFLLAAAWRMAWGPKIAGTLRCAACAKPFDFAFNLVALVDAVRAAGDDLPVEGGVYSLPGGCRFRLPTGEDERAVLGLDEDEAERVLLRRCIVEGDPSVDGAAVLSAMERVGSGLDLDLAAACSECGHAHSLRFQIQDYLLGALSADGNGLLEDTHRLALAYRWGLDEILSLPRSRRRALIALLDGDALPRVRELS